MQHQYVTQLRNIQYKNHTDKKQKPPGFDDNKVSQTCSTYKLPNHREPTTQAIQKKGRHHKDILTQSEKKVHVNSNPYIAMGEQIKNQNFEKKNLIQVQSNKQKNSYSDRFKHWAYNAVKTTMSDFHSKLTINISRDSFFRPLTDKKMQ